MNNFLDFIEMDIESKKTLISSLPIKTKTQKNKFNLNIDNTKEKYVEYKDSIKKYIIAKKNGIKIPVNPNENEINSLKEEIKKINKLRSLLNPFNSYFEKMGFDRLMYQMDNCYSFNFQFLNDLIVKFVSKFSEAGIIISAEDFNYTCYVEECMQAYFKAKNGSFSIDQVSEVFERVYWNNPDIVSHIKLNLRKLITKNEKKFNAYIDDKQNIELKRHGVNNYVECINKIQELNTKLSLINDESVSDIVNKCIKGEIDINQLLPNNKMRIFAYDSLIGDTKENDNLYNKIKCLKKLYINVNEFNNYLKFVPLIDSFKENYTKDLNKAESKDKNVNLESKKILGDISKLEIDLEKINKKMSGKSSIFSKLSAGLDTKELKAQSILKAKEINNLYKKYDEEYFKENINKNLKKTMTVFDLLNLYYSFDYYKNREIKKVFAFESYDEIINLSNEIDDFVFNTNNVISDGVYVFEETDIPTIIINKYKLNNLILTSDDLNNDSVDGLIGKIELVLRCNAIETNGLSVDQVWFLVQVSKMFEKED